MSESVEIEKIILRIGQKEIQLSIEEARELQEVLDKTLGAREPICDSSRSQYYPPYG